MGSGQLQSTGQLLQTSSFIWRWTANGDFDLVYWAPLKVKNSAIGQHIGRSEHHGLDALSIL
jgi:hypothetical protein